jgi:hypothetical protein
LETGADPDAEVSAIFPRMTDKVLSRRPPVGHDDVVHRTAPEKTVK